MALYKKIDFLFIALLLLLAPFVYTDAATTSKVTEIICCAARLVQDEIGKGIAILIVITTAISLFLGKVQWTTALTIAIGIGVLTGAEGLVTTITGSDDICQAVN